MKKLFLAMPILFNFLGASSQKLYGIVNLTAPFSGISYTKGHDQEDFRASIARINVSWKFDVVLRSKNMSHKLSFEEVPFEKYIKIINKFWNTPGDSTTILGTPRVLYSTAIDIYVLSYALHKEDKHQKKFLFRSKLKFNYSGGLGISLNRSKFYYRERYTDSNDGSSDPWSYNGYEAIHYRDGFGVFIRASGGVDFFNRKGKRRLCFNLFYNQGIKDMAHFDIHYAYGYWHDPAKRVDVPKQVLRSRGTTFGFSLGFPIKILK